MREADVSVARHGIDWPWSLMDRKLQLEWWKRFGDEALARVTMKPELEEVIRSRPPDRFFYAGEEDLGRGESITRRHTMFKTWPVKVVSRTLCDLLGMTWGLPDGQKIGVKIRVNERTYTHEEEVAGA